MQTFNKFISESDSSTVYENGMKFDTISSSSWIEGWVFIIIGSNKSWVLSYSNVYSWKYHEWISYACSITSKIMKYIVDHLIKKLRYRQ